MNDGEIYMKQKSLQKAIDILENWLEVYREEAETEEELDQVKQVERSFLILWVIEKGE